MKPTGALWGFALVGIPIALSLVPILLDNGLITGAVAALALGILNLVLKFMQENKPDPSSPQSRELGIPPPRESLLKRVLLG